MDEHGSTPGLRLPDETTAGAVSLQVSDLPRSMEFYQAVLGMVLIDRAADRAVLGVDGRELVELRAGGRTPRIERRLGLYHFAILLPDRAALGRALAHLFSVGLRPGSSDHLVSEALYLQDPDNLGIEIYCDRPRPEWRRERGELVMATQPLDTQAVLDAAGGGVWSGLPAGTRIGHVHLHVGDLAAAREFYHSGLGLDITVQSYPGALFLAAGGYHHHLGLNTWAGPRAASPEPHEARLLWWELILPGFDAVSDVAERLSSHGFPATERAPDALEASDPWGTVVRLKTLSQ